MQELDLVFAATSGPLAWARLLGLKAVEIHLTECRPINIRLYG